MRSFDSEMIKGRFGAEFWAEISRRGFTEDSDKGMILSKEGISFSMARAGSALSRKKANELLLKIKERIAEVNANDDRFSYMVERAVLFGSFVNSDRELLGDIDIALHVIQKPHIDWDTCLSQRSSRGSFLQDLYRPYTDVLKFIKGRSPLISLTVIEKQEAVVFGESHVFIVGAMKEEEEKLYGKNTIKEAS
jgi:predicted nucleotidyltransferase